MEEDHLQLGHDEGGRKPKVGEPENKNNEVKRDQKAAHANLYLSRGVVHVLAAEKNRQVLALHNHRDERQTCHHYWNYLQKHHQW